MHLERWLAIVRLRLRSLLRRGTVEHEMDRELRFHLERETAQNVSRGMTRLTAEAAALRRLGGVAKIQEECRDVRRGSFLESSIHDLHYAGRMLRQAPAFTLAAVATLALGIGANTAIFQLLDAVRLRSLPVAAPHELGLIRIAGRGGGFGISNYVDNLSFPLFEEMREHQQAFSHVFAWRSGYANMRIGKGVSARRATALEVTGDFFSTLGMRPAVGRLFRAEDDMRGCPAPTVVLSYPFWQSEFGGDLSAIGSRLTVMDQPLEIIGVAPTGFSGPEVGPRFDFALPLCSITALHYGDTAPFNRRDFSWLSVMGRLRPGWTMARA
jgi:hypothetical protein